MGKHKKVSGVNDVVRAKKLRTSRHASAGLILAKQESQNKTKQNKTTNSLTMAQLPSHKRSLVNDKINPLNKRIKLSKAPRVDFCIRYTHTWKEVSLIKEVRKRETNKDKSIEVICSFNKENIVETIAFLTHLRSPSSTQIGFPPSHN
ncbi:MAG: hypothetical protein AAGJ35_14720 [Myxococcota bacterium]